MFACLFYYKYNVYAEEYKKATSFLFVIIIYDWISFLQAVQVCLSAGAPVDAKQVGLTV